MVPPDPLRLHDLGRALPQFHEQQTASGPLSRRSTPSPEGAESAQEEPQGVAAGTSMELQPSPPALQQLHRLDRSSPDFDNQFSIALSGKEYIQCAPTLQGDDLVWLVNYLDEALGALDLSSPASRKCLRELRSICGTRGILPTSYTISPHLLSISPNLFACGSFGDVYQGTLNGSRVCIKRVRVHTEDTSEGAFKIFRREAVMWKRLEHPNILPLLGVTTSPFQLVSDWMSGGDLPEYIKKNSNADRIGLLCDVAKGLHYLHSRDVIHGDIKGANILVDDSGHACIADFDEATVVKDEDSVEDDSDILDHNPRWAAPEVLEKGTCSKKSDIFSFGMVMIEVFTGAVPFGDMPSLVAMSVITKGKRPPRPAHPAFTDNLWTLMQRCWDHDPSLRPQASGVLEILLVEGSTWGRLISHTLVTHERISLIETVFSDRNQVEMFEHLSGDNAQTLIDMLDEVLDNLGPEIRRNCLGYLARICDHRALLPKSLHIPLRYDLLRPPSYTGGFAEVWKGEYNGREVAIKTLRVYPRDDVEHFRRRFCRVAVTWRSLRHPNVSPLLGVTMTGNQFITVSDWMENGSIHEFLKKNTNANRLELLRDVTRGLVYMHDRGVIHGGLNGYNILTNDSGHACLSGFNLVSMVPDQSTETLSTIEGGAIPWSSPELLDPESFGLKEKRPTRESDCYALGMVIYEVLSGQVPFNACTPFSIFVKVLDDERPARPQGEGGKLFTDGIWKVVELCWKRQPGDRASAKHVLRYLEGIPSLPRPSSNVDADAETGPGDQPDSTLSGS
ncbi:kinase-like protein [Thelephora ganbajun]|uniref:Kinase-like protein n=1 Tax=Thelephora ganbajun TaxID=370292 RepID=A0ACB6YZ06_THEGA|nr:kinase-like protein [Thelephora ganbajun]